MSNSENQQIQTPTHQQEKITYEKFQINNNAYKIFFYENGQKLKYDQVLELLQNSKDFRNLWIQTISESGFRAIFWECIPVTRDKIKQIEFEFIVIESNSLAGIWPDPDTFKNYFSEHNIATFPNLGKDAMLVVPKPLPGVELKVYAHIAAFTLDAPPEQQHQLWSTVAVQIRKELENKQPNVPLWLSTSGLGVYWLHIRIDSSPKYYNWKKYKNYKL